MEIKVLVDNNTIIDRYFVGEPGVCYLISENDKKIVFDVGYSDIFIKNALQMNETLVDIDYVVISHGHNDHTGGLIYLDTLLRQAKKDSRLSKKVSIVSHPNTFSLKKFENETIGSPLDTEALEKSFSLQLTSKPFWFTEKLVFLGEIERSNDFENKEPIGSCECHGCMVEDYVLDDSAIVYKSMDGLVIITGCSHSGICNIIEYAKKVCQETKIADIIGGFHLLEPNTKQEQQTLKYFEMAKIASIHPCHCTSLHAKIALSKSTHVNEVGVGLNLLYM